MDTLKLLALGTLASFAVSIPAQGQTQTMSQAGEQTVEQLPPELAEPLEVGQQQAAEFFAPSRRQQSVEAQTIRSTSTDDLIKPPPGTQTPGQLTPERRLSIPIQ